jgi:BirA family biotin operon repressor/biotin-[acetyl-CoA-carboxylase] ligase
MKLLYFESLKSTQQYLIQLVKTDKIKEDTCIITKRQTDGIGSRNNSWTGIDGNLFFSFCIDFQDLPNDLQIRSTSIYFTTIFRSILTQNDSHVFMKWPNDLYIKNKKIGGVITIKIKDKIICGIGINTTHKVQDFEKLDININHEELLKKFFIKLKSKPSWNTIFEEFKYDFQKSLENKLIDKESKLNSDGSISINNENIYSLR